MSKIDDTTSNGDIAVYKQIEGHLRGKISAGEWPVGSMLPSRRDLARQYGVSPLTIERAITNMIASGLLRADDRRGTFVSLQALATLPAPPTMPAAETQVAFDNTNIGMVGSLYPSSDDHLELNNSWVRLLVHSLEHGAASVNARSQFFNRVAGPAKKVTPLFDTLLDACDAGVDAIALMGIGLAPEEIMGALGELNLHRKRPPIVVITSGAWLERPVPHVCYDNYAAGYEAGRHLIAKGCRSQMIFSPVSARWATERIAGVQAAVKHSGGACDLVSIVPSDPVPWTQEAEPIDLAYRRAKEILASTSIPDGVVALQDQSAFGFMLAAREAGLEQGRDYAIIGFDDEQHARTAQLSSMRPPIEMMGSEASRLLIRLLRGESANYQVNLQWNLIARASSDLRSRQNRTKESKYSIALQTGELT